VGGVEIIILGLFFGTGKRDAKGDWISAGIEKPEHALK